MGGGPDMPPGGLNRTFYGIETISVFPRRHSGAVLIVPFMELKRSPDRRRYHIPQS